MQFWAPILSIVVTLGAAPAPAATKFITGKDGAPMVLVPAGEFIMGSDDGDDDEKPQRRVNLDAFYIDKYEVTNARFRAAGMSPGRIYSSKFTGAKQPVVGVTWFQARDYCAKVGKRLPTEAEWEKAARGTDGRKYPWGAQKADCSRAIMRDGGNGCGRDRTWPVGSRPEGVSPYGAHDMAGNVWEWVQDRYGKNYYRNAPARNPKGPGLGSARVLRGGSWYYTSWFFRAANRTRFEPDFRNYFDGFRCAKALN